MTPQSASVRKTHPAEPPDLLEIVRLYPTAAEVLKAYLESDFHVRLATEHERKVRLVTHEGADVTDAISFTRVGERLVDVAGHRKEVEGWFKPLKDLFYRAHRAVCQRETEILEPITTFERTARANAVGWQREEERKRVEDEQRLQAEARAQEQARLEEEARLLEDRGEHDLAGVVLEQALHAPAPVVVKASTVPLVKGLSFRSVWKWRPTGGESPAHWARAEQLCPRELMSIDPKKVNAWIRLHGNTKRIPGLEIYDAGGASVRS